ncbi:transposase [candidate division KSB1 bacterium]|nr:transposase [candidate division KSB1 bacterium]
MRKQITQSMRSIFNSPDRETALAMAQKAGDVFKDEAPDFVRWLEENIKEGLTVFSLPRQYWIKIRTVNPLEPVNIAIRRRTRLLIYSLIRNPV